MNRDTEVLFARTLKQSGHSVTIPRKIIFQLLSRQEPMTIQQLLVKTEDKLNRASMYRTIELFERLGIIHRIHIGWKYKIELSETFLAHHHHIVCLKCAKVVDIKETPDLQKKLHQLAAGVDFTHDSHSLEIQGICSDCKQQMIH